LECFNKVLLAKQSWRLLHYPNTLVALIFKEKYYPWENFLEFRLGIKPSYAWRSIWNGQVLPKAGLIWRVGDGASIKI
jgi:hypothetical protein